MVQVGHQHRGRLEVDHAITTGFDLFEGGRVDGHGRLRWHGCGSRLGSGASLDITVKRHPSILGMNSTVMTEEEIAAHKGASALEAFERTFFGVCEGGGVSKATRRGVGAAINMASRTATPGQDHSPKVANRGATYVISRVYCDAHSG